ncbi:hypothetical protein PR048_032368 [Dryococelus australis]|uniref:Uncharacterized protein n=1 Tax=Dryococelus australis TaxID=614101 RepID=A0ABQ9G225_9NEOP|nr:hypothetical protein PR048_032368 [Dryococelus australis]
MYEGHIDECVCKGAILTTRQCITSSIRICELQSILVTNMATAGTTAIICGFRLAAKTADGGHGGVVVRVIAYQLCEPGSISGGGDVSGFLHVRIMLSDAAGRRDFPGKFRFPCPCIPIFSDNAAVMSTTNGWMLRSRYSARRRWKIAVFPLVGSFGAKATNQARVAILKLSMTLPIFILIVSVSPSLPPQGASVIERSACSPPTKVNRGFASGNRAGQCRWSAGFLGDIPQVVKGLERRSFQCMSFRSPGGHLAAMLDPERISKQTPGSKTDAYRLVVECWPPGGFGSPKSTENYDGCAYVDAVDGDGRERARPWLLQFVTSFDAAPFLRMCERVRSGLREIGSEYSRRLLPSSRITCRRKHGEMCGNVERIIIRLIGYFIRSVTIIIIIDAVFVIVFISSFILNIKFTIPRGSHMVVISI